jgi:hypothetical protein
MKPAGRSRTHTRNDKETPHAQRCLSTSAKT